MKEIWVPLKNLVVNGDNYAVSDHGNVRVEKTGQVLKAKLDKDGYCCVGLWLHSKKKRYRVHRLVATAFLSNLENKPEVNHKDGNKEHNFVDNLEWSTTSENNKHAYDTGLKSVGDESAVSRLKHSDVVEIKQLLMQGVRQEDIASSFKVSKAAIGQISRGITWLHVEVQGFDHYLELNRKGASRSKNKGKLSEQDIAEIRKIRSSSKLTYKEIGDMFGIHFKTVRNIISGNSWKHVD